jgi:hypothetical protein
MTTFTPGMRTECCTHCGQTAEAHHSDTRCYSTEELLNRLEYVRQTGRWPAPDEGHKEDTR